MAGAWQRGLAACVMLATATTPAAADPALWVARDADSTVYLFGTIHILRPGLRWLTPDVLRKLHESDALYLETDIRGQSRDLVESYGKDPDRPLTTTLDPEDLATVKASADSLGVDFAQIDPLRPWLAMIALSTAATEKAGYRLEGADIQLMRRAMLGKKPIRGFETAQDQVALLSGEAEARQVEMLMGSIEEMDRFPALLESMASAWVDGEDERLMTLILDSMEIVDEGFRTKILTDRNRRWADEIERLMDGSGTLFIAVGAAHLAGATACRRSWRKRGLLRSGSVR
ncbi:TraB/GumN family protein, partial [Methylobrevis pamukkalensis]|uniref:TraB/GumN family protein n=1 Tax=Methylobrevis pamukkalensis TaxID=1439726 RepID=UPI000846237A